jgi:hypothetical protein
MNSALIDDDDVDNIDDDVAAVDCATRTGLCLWACTREKREEGENGRKGAGRGVVVDGGSRRGKRRRTGQ